VPLAQAGLVVRVEAGKRAALVQALLWHVWRFRQNDPLAVPKQSHPPPWLQANPARRLLRRISWLKGQTWIEFNRHASGK
jgi:hypothetical protein